MHEGGGKALGIGMRQGCMMSFWLLNIFMDGCTRKMKDKVRNVSRVLKQIGMGWAVVTCLFTDDCLIS